MRITHAVLMTGALLVQAARAGATTGGPLTVEVLGWDRATNRVYVRQVAPDESFDRNCVFYFDLASARPTLPRVVKASQDLDSPLVATPPMERACARLERTLARLLPLKRDDEGMQSLIPRARVIADQTTLKFGGPTRRFVVDIIDRYGEPSADSIFVTTYRDPAVHILRRSRIPGRDARLLVLSYLGDPHEEIYEVQSCVFVDLEGAGVQRLDSFRGALR